MDGEHDPHAEPTEDKPTYERPKPRDMRVTRCEVADGVELLPASKEHAWARQALRQLTSIEWRDHRDRDTHTSDTRCGPLTEQACNKVLDKLSQAITETGKDLPSPRIIKRDARRGLPESHHTVPKEAPKGFFSRFIKPEPINLAEWTLALPYETAMAIDRNTQAQMREEEAKRGPLARSFARWNEKSIADFIENQRMSGDLGRG